MVYPALLGGADRPEVVIDLVLRPGEQPDQEKPVTWVRLDPGQASNLADIMGAAGQDALAAIIRQAADAFAAAPGS